MNFRKFGSKARFVYESSKIDLDCWFSIENRTLHNFRFYGNESDTYGYYEPRKSSSIELKDVFSTDTKIKEYNYFLAYKSRTGHDAKLYVNLNIVDRFRLKYALGQTFLNENSTISKIILGILTLAVAELTGLLKFITNLLKTCI